MIRWVIVVAAVYGMCCALAMGQGLSRNREEVPPAPPEEASISELMERNGGSLFKAASNGGGMRLSAVSYTSVPHQEPRTVHKHDLVTVIIREESDISSVGSTDLKKDATLDARIEEFIQLNNGKLTGGGVTDPIPSVKVSGSREMKGDATVTRTDSFTARVQAEVVDVKPNGTLILQARKSIKTDEDVQEFILSGTCRAQDITPDNTILSTQLYDQQLQKNHRGPVRDSTKRGWLTKLLDGLNVF